MPRPLPDYLASYQHPAEQMLRQDAIKAVEFSGATYQVLVKEEANAEPCWVFLQLDGTGGIQDAFCAGQHAPLEEAQGCIHLAAAYLSLFKQEGQPLHQRFAQSLWHHLCRLYAQRLGDDPSLLLPEASGAYCYRSASGKKLLALKPLTPAALQDFQEIIRQKEAETEETSLKFSNLPSEELSLWRAGHPSESLRYDLSFWSDLAKWLMRKQEEGQAYRLSFRYSKKQLPNWFQIDFADMEAGFYVSRANLPTVIGALRTVASPLGVYYAGHQSIARFTYDSKHHALAVEAQEEASSAEIDVTAPEAIPIEGWWFIPQKGFYAREPHELLQRPVLYGTDVAHALSEHAQLIASLIEGYQVYHEPTALSYRLYFDAEWNLHIQTYLFEPGDLSTEEAWLIDQWAYLEGEGFYAVEGQKFDAVESVISRYGVADFVNQNRFWLNTQEGFQTHVRSIEYQLTYEVSANNRLNFKRRLTEPREGGRQQDFGTWVYLEGYGFYSKTTGSFHYLLKPGVSLSADQIPLFIRMNREELALVPRFFTPVCPVVAGGVTIKLLDTGSIRIEPLYTPLPAYRGKTLRFFDDVVYVAGEGFHELPLPLRLPEKFRHPLELTGEEQLFFLQDELEALAKQAAFIDPRLIRLNTWRLMTHSIEKWPAGGKGWYRLRLFYQTERGTVSIKALHAALKRAEKFPFAFFEVGLADLRDERYEWLRQLHADRFEEEPEAVLLTALEFIRLNAFTPVSLKEDGDRALLEASRQAWQELTQWHLPPIPEAGGLSGHLRPYQELGLKWLWFLYGQRLSGLLCDDMGLGKTHQAMALLASVAHFWHTHMAGNHPHFLVVCPTSVIYHWEEKLKHFLPGLRVCSFYGYKRNLDTFHQHYDLLLTSYGVLRNEQSLLGQLLFEVAIFDEIQVAKNQFSRVYAALADLKAQMKVGLTGTPIENRLRELKSLFDIILPGYMPADQRYRQFFVKPIEKERNRERQEILHSLVRPFVLRRKKETVLQELPEKIEEVSYCDLLPYQRQLYAEVLQQRRSFLLEALQDGRQPVPYLHIFALLSSLKQICDHPAVYLKKTADYQRYGSGKWELFIELLREARESNQKVVVFSQYLGMLDIMESYLRESHIGFAAIRGATRHRQAQLQLFQENPDCEVFVASLQAAGLGIDLTAGSVVIHYDRWWNAARENQATDRVHRLGQTRGVQVFKLVSKGTFEEKIDAMITRKGRLLEEVVGTDEHEVMKVFSRDELMRLLELAEHPIEPL